MRGNFAANLHEQRTVEIALGRGSVEIDLQAGEAGKLCGGSDRVSGFGELLRRE
jgi:hypothetical protein